MPTDLSTALWRKAERSAHGDDCVEVAKATRVVGVRDSKAPARGHLEFSPEEWVAFDRRVRAGAFDLT